MKLKTCLLLITLSLSVLSSCKKDPPDFNDPNNYITGSVTTGSTGSTGTKGNTSPYAGIYYFTGTVDGKQVNWQSDAAGNGWLPGESHSTTEDSDNNYKGFVSGLLTNIAPSSPSLTISFNTIAYNAADDKSKAFNSFFTGFVGDWTYADNGELVVGNRGVSVGYTPGTNKLAYFSNLGDQKGSTFKVIGIDHMPAQNGDNESEKIKINFSCTLYDYQFVLSPIKISGEAVINIENDLD